MFEKIKEIFATEKFEEKLQELELCGECGWIFKSSAGDPVVVCGMITNYAITNDELFSVKYNLPNKSICDNCKDRIKRQTEKVEAEERLK